MTRKKDKRTGPKKRKLKGRERRLALAPEWVTSYRGKRRNIIKRYRKMFGVDWECAIAELEELGISHDSSYLVELRKTIAAQSRSGKRQSPIARWEFNVYHGIEADSDEHFAYIAGYTSGGAPFGVTWEEWEELEACEHEEHCEQSLPPGASRRR